MNSFFHIENGLAVIEKDRLSLSEVKKLLSAMYSSSENIFFHKGKEYIAVPEVKYSSSPCCGCAFSTCCVDSNPPPCESNAREDGRDIIWIKNHV